MALPALDGKGGSCALMLVARHHTLLFDTARASEKVATATVMSRGQELGAAASF